MHDLGGAVPLTASRSPCIEKETASMKTCGSHRVVPLPCPRHPTTAPLIRDITPPVKGGTLTHRRAHALLITCPRNRVNFTMPPPRLRTPPPAPVPLPGQATIERALGVFQRGLVSAREHLLSGWLWRRLWLAPEPWPLPPATLSVAYHAPLLPEPPPPGQEAAA